MADLRLRPWMAPAAGAGAAVLLAYLIHRRRQRAAEQAALEARVQQQYRKLKKDQALLDAVNQSYQAATGPPRITTYTGLGWSILKAWWFSDDEDEAEARRRAGAEP